VLGYKVPTGNQAMIVSGGRSSGASPFKVVVGHGAWVMPGFRKVAFLDLSMFEASVTETCVSRQGIQLRVTAVIAAKVASDEASIVNAAQRFLADQSQMATLTGRIFAGHLRSIVGSMTVEELITERQKLATEVLDASKEEMARIGLLVDALQISEISDGNSGYIAAMAAPHNAAIQRAAQVAQAEADQAAALARQQSQRAQAEYERDTVMAQAGYKAEQAAAQSKADAEAAKAQQAALAAQAEYTAQTEAASARAAQTAAQARLEADAAQAQVEATTQAARAEAARVAAQAKQTALAAQAEYEATASAAQAKAAQAGPLAAARAQQEVIDEQTKAAQRRAELREQELVAEVVKPAQADAERVEILARAEAKKTELAAEAMSTSNRVALDQLLIQQLPEMVRAAASGLQGAKLTILNGTAGIDDVTQGMVGTGMALYSTVKALLSGDSGPADPVAAPATNGLRPQLEDEKPPERSAGQAGRPGRTRPTS
jgi:uncharacterized membrane protein YqiK